MCVMSDLIPDEERNYQETVEWIMEFGVDRKTVEMSLAWARPASPVTREALEEVVGLLASYGEYVEVGVAIEHVRSLSRFSLPEPAETERRKVLKPIEDFMATVHGMNEMNVIRGLRKVINGEHSTFTHEVRLSVYGAPCGHEVPSHYPNGYGECDDCKEERRGI